MSLGYLGFILFVWFPGVLHAQSAALHSACPAPRLSGGYVVPDQERYDHGTNLTYACDDGHKPAVEGWWAVVTCRDGKWSHKPQCIDKRACLPPTSPNGKYTASQDGWYEEDFTIRITCDDGYTNKDNRATAKCVNGTWSSLPVCERSDEACGEAPRIPHAVINRGYQEVFAVDSELNYECEDGYAMEGGGRQKSIACISGFWSDRPTCKSIYACDEPPRIPHANISEGYEKRFDPDAEVMYKCEDGYTAEGGDGEISIYCISGSWTEHAKCRNINVCDAPPQIPHAVIRDLGDQELFDPDSSVTYMCEDGFTVEGGGRRKSVTCTGGSWTELPTCTRESRPSTEQPGAGGTRPGTGHGGSAGGGHTSRPVGGGSSTGSSHPQFTAVSRCGKPPVVPEAEVVQTSEMFLKYECGSFYKLLGPEWVRCYRDGTWSEVPTCKATFCTVDTNQRPELKPVGLKYIKDGEKEELECTDVWTWKNYVVVECTDGKPTISECCNRAQIRLGTC